MKESRLTAHDIVMDVLNELQQRSGFEAWWETVAENFRTEIHHDLAEVVERSLKVRK